MKKTSSSLFIFLLRNNTSVIFSDIYDDSILYENKQEKLSRITENVTEEKARELGISRRNLFYWKKKIIEGKQIIVKNKLKYVLFSRTCQ